MGGKPSTPLLLAAVPSDRPGRVARRALSRSRRRNLLRIGVPGGRGSERRMIDPFDDPAGYFSQLILLAPALLVAVTVHEFAHAVVAVRLADPPPRRLGRLPLNPLPHIDPIGAIAFMLAGFGWAKPVPVNAGNLAHPVRDMAWVAVAGPLANFTAAFLTLVIIGELGGDIGRSDGGLLLIGLDGIYKFNLALGIFNLIPLPPPYAGRYPPCPAPPRRGALPALPATPRVLELHPSARAGRSVPAHAAPVHRGNALRRPADFQRGERRLADDRPPRALVAAGSPRGAAAPSWRRSHSLRQRPPPYPVSEASPPIRR